MTEPKPLRLGFVGPAASITFRRWVDWFRRRGHEAMVYTVEPSNSVEFSHYDLSAGAGPGKIGRIKSLVRLARELRRVRPDVVHFHYARGVAWGGVLAGIHPYIVTPWGSDILEEQGAFKEWFSRPLTQRLLGKADLVTVHSRYLESRVRPMLREGQTVARIGWGVDRRSFREGIPTSALRQRWGIHGEHRVLFSPRLAQRFYRHDMILKALPAILAKVPEALLVIAEPCADADYIDELKHVVATLGLTRQVRFVGQIPYTDMPVWYNMADATVMVPESDGMPNSLWEAMACGSVPILRRLPQYAEVIRHGVNGFLLGDSGAPLSETAIRVLSDAVLRRTIAERNRDIVREQADQDREMTQMEWWYGRLSRQEGLRI